MKKRTDVDSVFGSGMDTALADESASIDFMLARGDVSAHHPNLIHGSGPNRSQRRRCGLTIRYIPTTTEIVTDTPRPSAFLRRGRAVPEINDYLPLPRYESEKHMPFSGCESSVDPA
jgi:phytanoyl-CoA hydroxylase